MASYSELIEHYDPGTKHPFFYLSACSARRPEVLRYASRLNRFTVSGTVLITTAAKPWDNQGTFDHVFFVKPPFGPYPVELAESYPVGQAELPQTVDDEARAVALQNVLKLLKLNRDVTFVFWYDRTWAEQPLIDEIRKYAEVHSVE
jgi:7-cyano-7-deazaguanine tRNA-ribosyltransferase